MFLHLFSLLLLFLGKFLCFSLLPLVLGLFTFLSLLLLYLQLGLFFDLCFLFGGLEFSNFLVLLDLSISGIFLFLHDSSFLSLYGSLGLLGF